MDDKGPHTDGIDRPFDIIEHIAYHDRPEPTRSCTFVRNLFVLTLPPEAQRKSRGRFDWEVRRELHAHFCNVLLMLFIVCRAHPMYCNITFAPWAGLAGPVVVRDGFVILVRFVPCALDFETRQIPEVSGIGSVIALPRVVREHGRCVPLI